MTPGSGGPQHDKLSAALQPFCLYWLDGQHGHQVSSYHCPLWFIVRLQTYGPFFFFGQRFTFQSFPTNNSNECWLNEWLPWVQYLTWKRCLSVCVVLCFLVSGWGTIQSFLKNMSISILLITVHWSHQFTEDILLKTILLQPFSFAWPFKFSIMPEVVVSVLDLIITQYRVLDTYRVNG